MTISGTSGDDNLTGTSGADTFNLRQGGNDTVDGSGGDDVFIFGGTFTAADTVDGGAGNDLLRLDGDYTGANAVTLGAGTITSVETIQLSSGNSYTLTLNDANVAAGKTLYINGTGLVAGNDMVFDGSAETDGNLRVSGGLGDDSITMGAGLTVADRINGGGGNDTLNLNGAYDITLSRTTIGNIANLTLGGQHSYHIVTNDGTVAAGATVAVNAASLGASDTLNFNATHELDGGFDITAGAGLTEIVAGRGNDSFHLGANLTAGDRINGGLGNDSVYLSGGDYNLTLSKSTLVGIENLHLAGGNDYHIASAGRIDANATLAVDANSLTSSDTLYLDFSKEAAGSVIFDVSAAQATLIGGAQGDAFDFSVSGQGGLVAGDRLDGGAGYDHLYFDGDYTGSHALTMNATTAVNIEEFDFNTGHSYNVTLASATVAAGATLKIDASAVDAANGVTFNGSAAGATSTLQFLGGAGNDVLTGGGANDSFDLSQGGSDTATGGAGNNIFTMGAALDGGDVLNGGAGNDTVSVSGDYSAGVTLGSMTLTGVETLSFAAGHNYNLASNDGNVASGLTLTVNAGALASANGLTFNGGAETNGSFAFTGGAGNDALTGGGQADTFDLTKGGNDTAHGGGGNDIFTLGSKFTAADSIDGGAGSDTLGLNGDYSAGLTFGAATIGAVDVIQLAAGHSYNLTTNDGNVAAGQVLTVDATALGASDTVTFDGGAETNGSFTFKVGANFGAADHLTGATTTASVTVGATTQTVFASALELNGDFSALSIGGLSNIGIIKVDAGHNYSLTASDATVAAGQFVEVDASALAAANGLTFNGAAETDGTYLFKGGAGNDVLSGGALADTFDLSQGGNDTAHGGGGNDVFAMGAKLSASDSIDGGAGSDTLALSGDYSAGVTLGAATLTAIESVLFAAGSNYNLTTNDGNVAAGQALTVDASALAAANALIFDGSAESDGSFALTGGAGNDVLSGGALGDTFNLSKGGADTVHGNGGNDRISVTSQASFAADQLDGGAGSDTVTLTGDYGTLTTLTATSLTDIETLKLATAGNNYNFKMDDGNVAAGKELTVDATALANSDKLTFNGGAESDGGYVFDFAGNYSVASDHLTGGTHIGSYVLNPGATVSAYDAVIDLNGDYSAGLTFGAGSLTRIGAIRLHDSGHSEAVTFNGLTLAANQAMIVDASSFTANDGLTFDASAETHGFFYVAGGAGDDVLTGGGDGTYFDVSQGGFDTVTGTAGNDFIYGGNSALGGEYNGGAGTDTLILQGDYQTDFGLEVAGDGFPSIEIIQMLQSGFDYIVHMFDTALPAGATLTFDASNLTTNALQFDGSNETDGFLHVIGGAGNDTITGGGQADVIDISKGGNDTVDGKGGDDIVLAGAAFTAADHIVGNGADNDTVVLDGDYSAGLIMAAHTIANVGVISCEGNFAYNITLNDANMSGSNILKIEAFDSSQFTVDASAETTAFIDMYGGPGNDVMTGGASGNFFDFTEGGSDTATGNGGRDLYECSTKAHDLMIFNAVSDSTGLDGQDQIVALNFALDTLRVSSIGAVTGVDAKVNGGVLNDNNNFDTNLSAAIGAGQLAAHHAVIFAPGSGTFSGHTFLIIDENGTAGYQSGGDLVMEISGYTGTMTVSDFT